MNNQGQMAANNSGLLNFFKIAAIADLTHFSQQKKMFCFLRFLSNIFLKRR